MKTLVRLNNIVLLIPQSRDSQSTFLAPTDHKKICNYERVLKQPSLPINTKVPGIKP